MSIRFILIKNRTSFENSRKITTVVFDKTGMLTKSEHPIATGILKKASDLKISTPSVKDFKAITGQGVEAIVEDKSVLVVGPDYLKEESMNVH